MNAKNTFYSCVVDSSAIFYFQTWGLIHSLMKRANVKPSQIFVHHTQEVEAYFIEELVNLGVNIRPIHRFGDGKYCNKTVQLNTPEFSSAECIFLLDTDIIVLDELWELYTPQTISGKVVDLANPDLETLKCIFDLAGFKDYPAVCKVDCNEEQTFHNNLNGGLYVIPGKLSATLGDRWQHWALWLLEHIDLLKQIGKENHVDQMSFSLATHDLSIPIKNITRKYNFPVHLSIEKTGYPAVLHYHRSVSKVGLIEFNGACDADFQRAIQEANQLIGGCFNNKVFWSFRYKAFPELGSGVGSREQNLEYKRALLHQLGIEESPSILDVGCGDLEVIKTLNLHRYTGIDVSTNAIEIAQKKRPDLKFMLYTGKNDALIPAADTVLCFEVLIHQKTSEEYSKIINFLAQKTQRRLIVSGYTEKQVHHDQNHMISYHESLFDSLRKTGKFSTISKVGSHPGIDVVLAEVKPTVMAAFMKAAKWFMRAAKRSLKTVFSFLSR